MQNGRNMYHNAEQKLGRLIQCMIAVVSLVTAILLLIKPDENGYYKFMFILPLVHTCAILTSYKAFQGIERSVIRLIIIGGYTIRNVITPLLILLGNYTISTIKVDSSSDILFAAALMALETAVAFVVVNYESGKDNKTEKTEQWEMRTREMTLPQHTVFSVVLFVVSGLMLLCLLRVPSISNSYQNLWTVDDNTIIGIFSTISAFLPGSVDRLLYAFFLMFFSIMQIVWSTIFIFFILKKIGDNLIGIFLSFIVVFSNTLVVAETSAYTMFVIMVLVLFMIRIFRKQKRTIIGLSAVGVVFILSLMIIVRANTYNVGADNPFAKLATFLNAYFPGIVNVSVMPRVETPSKIVSFYYDLYKSIPLQSLIPPLISGERLSNYFNYAAGTSSQILPFIGQTYFYFSIFGPVIQAIVIHFALKWERELKRTDNCIWYAAYMTGAVIFGFGCNMYDITILLAFVFKTIIPFFVFALMTNMKLKQVRKEIR